MSRASQQVRFERILRLLLYIHQHGGTADELAALNRCTDRTVHRDLAVIRGVGIKVQCESGIYSVSALPTIQKLEFIPSPSEEEKPPRKSSSHVRTAIFRKWYKTETKGSDPSWWYVVRADKKDSKGTRVGPVSISGKSWFPIACAEANRRNDEILAKRKAMETLMKQKGFSLEYIEQVKADALAETRRELGNDNYREERA